MRHTRRLSELIAGLALAMMVLWQPLAAQTIQGSILGTVSDSTGGLMPGVEIEVRNQETNFVRRTITNDAGFYLLDHLDPGTYEVKAKLLGFKEFARPDVRLESNAALRVNVGMEVGEISDTMVVQAPTPVIQTESGNIATVIDEHLLLHQATVNRAPFMQMMFGAGGVWTGGGYSMIGSRGSSGSFTIDGMSTNDVSQGRENSEMWIDSEASKEQRLSYVNNQAEFGKMVVANQTLKTGTNRFHGGANWLHTQGILWAKSPLMRLGEVTKAPTGSKGVQHRFGGGIGGPVILPGYNGKDRTFFFFRYDGWRLPGTAPYQQSIATDAMRAGDFSAFAKPLIDPATGSQFPGNKIPPGRLNATVLKYLDHLKYPRPNFGNPLIPSNNLVGGFVSGRNDFWVITRVDHKLTDSQNLSYHFIRRNANFVRWDSGTPWLPGYILRINDNYSSALAHTYSLTPTSVNEFKLGFLRQNSPDGSHLKGKDIVDAVGLTGYPEALAPGVDGLPAVSLAGQSPITSERARNFNIQNEWEINNSFSFQRGNHQLKTGVNLAHSFWSRFPASPSAQFGSFSFDGFATGNSFGDFLLGIPRTASRSSAISPYYGRRNSIGVFFQDDWKIRSDLTVNLGMRYEFFSPFREEQNRIHSFAPKSGSVVVPNEQTIAKIHPLFPKTILVTTAGKAGLPEETLIENDVNNMAPRVGFAWRSNLWDVVVRGGYGVYYSGEAKKGFGAMTAGPFVATETFDNAIVNGQPLFAWPQAFPQAGGARPLGVQNINATSARLRDSYTQQWNLTLEKQFGDNGIRLSYIGHGSMQLPFRRNLNQPLPSTTPFSQARRPFPQIQNISLFESGATQSYNAFQIQWDRRFVRGVSINSHYTWSKNLTDSDDSGGVQGTSIEDAYDRVRERGNALVGPRHSWRTQYVFELPVGQGRRYLANVPGVVNAVLGGWSTSGMIGLNTGMYATPRFTGRDISGTNVSGGRPDRTCDGKLSGANFSRWFDVSCFAIPAAGSGRFGNAGKGIIQGPFNSNWNARIFKYFIVRENLKVRFDAQLENVLDHATWDFVPGDDGVNISSAGAGRVTRAFSWGGSFIEVQRMVHFELKIEF